jgi:hypothetical protein
MINEQTAESAEHLVLLIKAAILDADTVGQRIKLKRLIAIINVADDIRKQAKAELEAWEGLDDILYREGHE